jgi:hypothetical protein
VPSSEEIRSSSARVTATDDIARVSMRAARSVSLKVMEVGGKGGHRPSPLRCVKGHASDQLHGHNIGAAALRVHPICFGHERSIGG